MKEIITKLLHKEQLLKAKEIAKKLSLDKKDVNAFLYANTKYFQQSEAHEWSLVKSDELVIELPAAKWIDCPSLEKSLQTAGSPLDSGACSVVFVIPEGNGILIEAAARLLALCNQLANQGKSVTLNFEDSQKILTYLDRMGALNHLNKQIKILPTRPDRSRSKIYAGNSSALVEMGSIELLKNNNDLIVRLTEAFVKHTGESYRTVALTIFGELVGNVIEHSGTVIPGFAALQVYNQPKKRIQTIVSDNGVGISTTLRPALKEHHPSLYKQFRTKSIETDIALATEVVSRGEISRFGSSRGLGFKSTTKQAMKFNAKFSLRQETFAIRLQYKGGALLDVKKFQDLVRIDGTHICFDFYVDNGET